jgi:glycosyltransferase involved in cell wall biosynthesis
VKILALNWQDLKNPLSGGAEVHLEELLRRLAAMGHSVTLFCSNFKGGATEEVVEGVRIIRAGSRFNFNWIAPRHIRRLIRSERYDLFLEDINKIPFYTPFYQRLPTLVIVPHLFSTTVFSEINFVLGSYIYISEMPLTLVYRRKRFCVISESTQADMVARGIPEKNISVIHCGIDAGLYNNDKGYAKYDHPSVLYLGRIKKYKSVHHLIEAFKIVKASIPDARLRIVGAGDYLPRLQARAEELGLSGSVEFPGFVPEEKKVEYLCRTHVAVYPSLKEGWGLTNIEANSCGTAVVAADTPGLRDSVKDGVSGLLYEYGDIAQLADKIRLLLTDHELRARVEAGGLAWAARFNWDLAADRFLNLCREVAEAG